MGRGARVRRVRRGGAARAAEDYATLDQLSGGRLDIIIGKGNDPDQNALFGYEPDGQWDRNREKYELLRRLLRETGVSWSGRYRPALTDATTQPRPYRSDGASAGRRTGGTRRQLWWAPGSTGCT